MKQVNVLKYLVIYFDERPSFTEHVNIVASKPRKMLGAVASVAYEQQIRRVSTCCIRPLLSYGCVIAHGKTKAGDGALERVIKTSCKMVF